jgi:lipoate-protein ligase B
LYVAGLGRVGYGEALILQRDLAERRITNAIDRDLLLLVEHPPVITLGRGFHEENLTTSRDDLTLQGVEVHEAERGGDVTFHGPGQLVGYTIFDLQEHKPDLHLFLRQIESTLIRALETFGLPGSRKDGLTGVWVENRKIASIGIHVKRWVTWHGFALNVSTDLSYFDLIVPCGINDVTMTSVRRELGERAPAGVWGQVADAVVQGFAEVFDQRPQMVDMKDLLD